MMRPIAWLQAPQAAVLIMGTPAHAPSTRRENAFMGTHARLHTSVLTRSGLPPVPLRLESWESCPEGMATRFGLHRTALSNPLIGGPVSMRGCSRADRVAAGLFQPSAASSSLSSSLSGADSAACRQLHRVRVRQAAAWDRMAEAAGHPLPSAQCVTAKVLLLMFFTSCSCSSPMLRCRCGSSAPRPSTVSGFV